MPYGCTRRYPVKMDLYEKKIQKTDFLNQKSIFLTKILIEVKWIIFQLVGRRSFKKNTINQELNIDQIVQFGGFGTIIF
jgi:hypothetical protein